MNDVGNADIAKFASVLFLAMMLFVNIISFVAIINSFGTNFKIPISKTVAIFALLCLITMLYVLLISKKNLLKIKKSFEIESAKEKNKGRVILLIYFLLSIALLILSFVIEGS
jgi:hypothetical protein